MPRQTSNSDKTRFYVSALAFAVCLLVLFGKRDLNTETKRDPKGEPSEQKASPAKQTIQHPPIVPVAVEPSSSKSLLSDYEILLDSGILPTAHCFKTTRLGLNEGIIQLAGLDDEQLNAIHWALHSASESLSDLQKKHSRSSFENDDNITIRCDAFPEEGLAIKEKLITELSDILDSVQFQLISQLSNDWQQLSEQMRAFGQTPITYEYSIRATKDDVGYKLKREAEDATLLGSYNWSFQSKIFSRNTIEDTDFGALLTPALFDELVELRDGVAKALSESDLDEKS